MAEEPSLSRPHPYKHDAWFMLGYLRQCIVNHGAINTTDWLEALKASEIPVDEELEVRRIVAELGPAKCMNCGAPARKVTADGIVCTQWPLCQP